MGTLMLRRTDRTHLASHLLRPHRLRDHGWAGVATVLALVFLPAVYLIWPQDRHASEATCPWILLRS